MAVTFSRSKLCRSATVALGSASLLIATSVEAAGPGWSANFMTINTLIASDSGTTIVVTGNDNPMGCSVPNWARIDPSATNYAFISSSLLTAFSQGKQVKLWEYGCWPDGSVHFIAVWMGQ